MENTTQKASLTPKFFFVSLGVIVGLITSVSSFLILLFETLNKRFPDVLNATYQYGYNSSSFDSLRAPLATLIIFFPAFFILSYFWRKFAKVGLGHIDTIIRKWMIYLILFFASITIIIDLVTLVQYFVAGEITNRFIFKVLGTIIVAALIWFYYYFELTGYVIGIKIWKKKTGLLFGLKSIIFVLALITWSFVIMGSPAKQRALRFDDRRVSDLQSIQSQVINYWQQKEKLPATLSEIANPISSFAIPVDPEFEKGIKYEYNVTGKMSFELCGTFSLPMPKGWQEYNSGGGVIRPMSTTVGTTDVSVPNVYPYPSGTNDSWDHQAGRTCFARTIDKDLYPPYPKILKN